MLELDPADPAVWRTARRVVNHANRSSLHCAIASIDADGSPHASPIGSVRLDKPGHGTYLDVFNANLRRNVDRTHEVTILAVDSRRRTWIRAMLTGRFEQPPGVRLRATVGPSRAATEREVAGFLRAVRFVLWTPGGRAMWGRPERLKARDLTITEIVPIRIGTMTRDNWQMADSVAAVAGTTRAVDAGSRPTPAGVSESGGPQ